jgi:antitoxin PrlF
MGAIDQKKFNVTVTSKGQMTIPADVREALGIVSGDKLELALNDKGGMELVKKTRSYKDIIGSLAHLAREPIEDLDAAINKAIGDEMMEQNLRSLGQSAGRHK